MPHLASNQTKTLEQELTAVLRHYCSAIRLPYAPDVVLNNENGFYGEDAEELIYAAAKCVGLSKNKIDKDFPYDTYFGQEQNIALWPFTLIGYLFRRRSRPAHNSLTAQEFILLMIGMCDDLDVSR